MASCGFILYEEDVRRISGILAGFLRETEARCCLLIDRSGQLMVVEGDSDLLDTMSLSALAAGAFASTREIARLVGETEFSVLFHQGIKRHIHVSNVDENTLMMAIFDDKTPVGIIRLYSCDTEKKIAEVIRQSKERQATKGEALGQFDLGELGEVFKSGNS